MDVERETTSSMPLPIERSTRNAATSATSSCVQATRALALATDTCTSRGAGGGVVSGSPSGRATLSGVASERLPAASIATTV